MLKALVRFPVVMRLWETPVPIPNTTVKTQAADDTWLETARESKWLPESIIKAKWLQNPQADTTLNSPLDGGTVLENWPLIADGDTYGETMKYLIFAAGDQPYEEITNNDMAEGPSCIVVKESFGNCFIPFLVNHYKNVYVVDYRHYGAGTVTQLAQEKGVDDVLLLSNISMTRNEGLVSQFSNIF